MVVLKLRKMLKGQMQLVWATYTELKIYDVPFACVIKLSPSLN